MFEPTKEKKSGSFLSRERRRKNFKLFWLLLIFFLLLAVFLTQPVSDIAALLNFTRAGRYLVLFQNDAELRGGGGFLGSFAVVDLEGRKLKRYYFESNIYKKDNEFTKTNYYPLPTYFQEGLGEGFPMALRDANYHADFRDSGWEIEKFYRLEYGDKVDGIVAINASAAAALLKLTGPIVLQDGKEIGSENFFNLLQQEIQVTYFREQQNKNINEPKTILKEMAEPLVAKASNISPIKLYFYFKRVVKEKNLMFWFGDERQTKVESKNWIHKIEPYDGESIFISNNNIAGEKTSRYINEELKLLGSSRASRDRVLIYTREYPWLKNQFNSDKTNKNYSRVFLPKNTVVNQVKVNNMDWGDLDIVVEEERNRLVVGFWSDVAPGQKTVAQISYTLPIGIKTGKIWYLKQPGAKEQKLTVYFGNKKYFEGVVSSDKKI